MARKRKPPASRDAVARRWTLGLILVVAGLGVGGLLGALVVGSGLHGGRPGDAGFARLSSNPDALVADSTGSTAPCPGCADSYGVGARLRETHDRRMSEPFRELGAVDVDTAPPADPSDDYRYGGRFPDPPPRTDVVPAMVLPVAIPDTAPAPTDAKQLKGPGVPPEPVETK